MSAAARERPPWLVGVRRSPAEDPVGAGLLVTPRHVLTCAHVVRPGPAPEVPGAPVFVTFQYAGAHDPVPATVVPGGWHPAGGAETGDVAVLELAGPPPAGAGPAPLRTTDPGTWDHRFRAYGYPKERSRQGVPVRGEIIGHAGSEWLQVEANPHGGWALEQGFSGSPVWDMTSRGVVGMLVARDSVKKADRRTAYAIRVETLVRYWPPLAPYVHDATTEELRSRLERLLWLPLTAEGEIPRIGRVDPYDIGVARSKYGDRPGDAAPYVPRRRQDEELAAALTDARFVLLVGRSKAGKSRTLYEALRSALPGARLIVPRRHGPDHRVLDDISRLVLPTGGDRSVLWLDDLHHYLQPGGLDLQILDRLARRDPPVTVVATLPARQRAALTAMENDVGRVARTVLGKARTVELPARLATEDAELARQFYPAEDFTARGIGELMVAATALEQRFDDAADSCPAGRALVKAATDWHRMGMAAPVPEAALRELFDAYLSAARSPFDADESLFRSGLTWAREPVAGSIALLERVPDADGGPAYAGSPYLSEYLDSRAEDPSAAVPLFAWEYLAARQPHAELLRSAYTALIREEPGIAVRMLQQVARAADDPESSARASLMLGEIRLYEGDFAQAVTLLGTAASSAVEDVAPLAQVELAGVLGMTGERARARGLLEAALGSRDPQVSQLAQVGLAGVLALQGETQRAEQLLEAVLAAGDTEVAVLARTQWARVLTGSDARGIRSAHAEGRESGKPGTRSGGVRAGSAEPTERPWALSRTVGESLAGQITALAEANLGSLYAGRGRLDRAEELLKSAVSSGGYHAAPQAQWGLGELYILQGRHAEARRMLESVLLSGHPLLVPPGKVSLGIVLLHQDEAGQALPLLREIADLEHPDQGPRAACVLGEWYAALGEAGTARSWLERAVASGHPDWAPTARVDLAVVATAEDSRAARPEELLREVMESGHPHQAPRAADFLGDLLAADGRVTEAEDAYRTAIDSGHRDWAQIARIDLASLLAAARGGTARARELLTAVMESGHPHQAPRAADFLGDLLAADGRVTEAEDAYRTAIDSGHGEWSLIARIDLAVMLADGGDFARAEDHLRVVAASDNTTVVLWATALLGMVLVHDDRPAEGFRCLRQAAAGGDTPPAQLARFHLAKFLLEGAATADEEAEARELLRSVVDGTPSDVTEAARAYLCMLLLRRGDHAAAEELLLGSDGGGGTGRDGTDADMVAAALLDAGEYLLDAGELEAAGELLEGALNRNAPASAPRATALLGVVRRSAHDFEAARRLLSDALATGEPGIEPMARRYLGSTLFRMGRFREAEEVLLPLARSENAEHRPQALRLLGQVLAADRRPEEAYPWFERAVACGDAETESAARYDFAELLLSTGQRKRAEEVWGPEVTGDAPPESLTPSEAPSNPSTHPHTTPSKPPELPGAAPPHPLPAALLSLLGDVASAEDDEQEARYWYDLAEERAAADARRACD
ncbi:tetratricopeptide repeat protein [Streptomyces telluris]|uniref:Tetratricopeptide repeat protein n=3 Tax=Streptomyces telluris TaxID=2720021 RepID=A0A9X2LLL8_9ACTN|nr:tetratricopeptide repeat protein [Streptomyces telluris]MCQ8773507.1 tetratricopeptide repeat protein [Streptomyces telluris]